MQLPPWLAGIASKAVGLGLAYAFTSLVTIVSLYELSGSLGLAVQGDPNWRPFKIEGYLFITLIYFVFCLSLSRYSLWVERQVSHR